MMKEHRMSVTTRVAAVAALLAAVLGGAALTAATAAERGAVSAINPKDPPPETTKG